MQDLLDQFGDDHDRRFGEITVVSKFIQIIKLHANED